MPKKPNILLMMADDHRHFAMSAVGIENVKTPFMDWLGETGIRFEQNRHTGSHSGAICVPARASLHTGLMAGNAMQECDSGGMPVGNTISASAVTLGQTLQAAGYDSFITGKWHNDTASLNRSFNSGENIFLGGMDDHFNTKVLDYDPTGTYDLETRRRGEKHSSELFAESAIRYIESHDGDKPFFTYVAFTSPHDPRTAPKAYHEMYPASSIELQPNCYEQHPFDQGDYYVRDEKLADFPRTKQEVQQHVADYYAMITHQDAQMQRIVDALDRKGELENTIIIYTGDHGLAVGQHGLMGKQNLYEHSVRVPLLMRGPNLPSGETRKPITHTMDLYPTICELVDAELSGELDAMSLCPLIQNNATKHRASASCFYSRLQRSVTDGKHKLIAYHRVGENGTDREQLFDLESDPWEMTDLISDMELGSVVEALRVELPARFGNV